jgi:hypothetical protein
LVCCEEPMKPVKAAAKSPAASKAAEKPKK